MSKSLNLSDRDTHLEAVIKSNLISLGLSSLDIEMTTKNIAEDVLDVLGSYDSLIQWEKSNNVD